MTPFAFASTLSSEEYEHVSELRSILGSFRLPAQKELRIPSIIQ